MVSADPPPPSQGPVRPDVVYGVLGAWALVFVQFVVLTIWERERLSGIWEIQSGGIGLLPAWLLLAAVPGAIGGVCARWLRSYYHGRRSARLQLVSLAAFFGLCVGWGVGGGRHLADLAPRLGFTVCVALLFAVSAYVSIPLLVRLLGTQRPRSKTHAGVVVGLTSVAVVALESANQMVLVRLYPAFHAGLSVLSFVVAGWGSGTLAPRQAPKRRQTARLSILATCATSAILLVPASQFVAGFDNFRWIVGESAPSLRWGLQLASTVAPPPELDESLAQAPLGERRSQSGVDLRGRDLLLISIDALRADHVGAYGYERPTTPAIDELAESGVLFEAAYAPTPHTSYSVTSLMTGKYMRPLLLQGAGDDSDLWAHLLQAYDYRTGAFYPPAVFFIDTPRFSTFQKDKLGFEYAKIEFAEGDLRVRQFQEYLRGIESGRRVFTWVHLFGPHEPYEAHEKYDFGKRDIDLYDGEIRAADETVGRIVAAARARDPKTVVILTADHGEEFGDHGGRYHGTSVYDEQVRVPLIINVPGHEGGAVVSEPVQTIDLLPTVLAGLQIPTPPRIRGRDLTPLLDREVTTEGKGRAVAETDDYTLLAEANYRLICARRSGACRLYDVEQDPSQTRDVSAKNPQVFEEMRGKARALSETHGKYESTGLRAEGKGWPAPILRGISGDAEVAPALARLLDDADKAIRAKSAELLFHLATSAEAPALRLAMTREEDSDARAWIALSLTRLGQGAPLVFELLTTGDLRFRRYAALALAEAGNDAGEDELIRWWARREDMDHEMALRVLGAFARIRSKEALPVLIGSLKDVRLRPHVAETLGAIGDDDARPHLALQLAKERYRSARLPLAQAIVKLGGDDELIVPLRRFLGVPERLEGGLGLAVEAGILEDVGGPKAIERRQLQQLSDSGVQVSVVVPPGPRGAGVRLIVRARSKTGAAGTILVEPGSLRVVSKKDEVRSRNQPEIKSAGALRLQLPQQVRGGEGAPSEVDIELPERFGARPGHHLALEIFAPQDIEILALAAVPLREDLPPPPPEPWDKGAVQGASQGPE